MARLSAEAVITTTTEVQLKPALLKKVRLMLDELRQLKAQAKALKPRIDKLNEGIEGAFADDYEALEAGVKITTPFGEVPVKLVKGKTPKKLNMKKLLDTVYVKDKKGKFVKASPADLDGCYDEGKDKKPYLGVWLPDEDGDDDEG
jgi:hypothetical protein